MKNRVLVRLAHIEDGYFGDMKRLSDDLFELRMFFSGGLRIYYTIRHGRVMLLLSGGDKSSQQRDIAKAKQMLNELE